MKIIHEICLFLIFASISCRLPFTNNFQIYYNPIEPDSKEDELPLEIMKEAEDQKCFKLQFLLSFTSFYDPNFSKMSEWSRSFWQKNVKDPSQMANGLLQGIKLIDFFKTLPKDLEPEFESIKALKKQSEKELKVYLENRDRKNLVFLKNELEKELEKKQKSYDKSYDDIERHMMNLMMVVEEGAFNVSLGEIKAKYRNLKNLMYGINFKMKNDVTYSNFLGLIKSLVSNVDLCESLAKQLAKSTEYLSEIKKKRKERLFDLSIINSQAADSEPQPRYQNQMLNDTNAEPVSIIIGGKRLIVSSFEELRRENYAEVIQFKQERKKGHRKNKSSIQFLEFILPDSERSDLSGSKRQSVDFAGSLNQDPNIFTETDEDFDSRYSDVIVSPLSPSSIETARKVPKEQKTESATEPNAPPSKKKISKRVGFSESVEVKKEGDYVPFIRNAESMRLSRGVKIFKPDQLKPDYTRLKDVSMIHDRQIENYEIEIENLEKLNESLKDMLRQEVMKAVSEIRRDLVTLNKYAFYRENVQKLTEIKAKVWQSADEVVVLKTKHRQIENILQNNAAGKDGTKNVQNGFKLNNPSELVRAQMYLNNYFFYKLSYIRNKEMPIEKGGLYTFLKKSVDLNLKHKKLLERRDVILSRVFAEVENINREDFNCLSKAELLYLIAMFKKTGVISNLGNFLDMFLTKISLKKSFKFMVYVYGQLANKSFMRDLTANHYFRIKDGGSELVTWEKRQRMVFQFKKRMHFLLSVSEEMTLFTQASFDNQIFDDSIGQILFKSINEEVFLKILHYTNYEHFKVESFVDKALYENAHTIKRNLTIVTNKIDPNLSLLVRIMIKDWCDISDFLLNVPFMAPSVGKLFAYFEKYLWELLVTRFHTPGFIMHDFSNELEKCKEKYYRIFQVEQNYIEVLEDKLSEKDIVDTGFPLREVSTRSDSEHSGKQPGVPNLQNLSSLNMDDSELSSEPQPGINPADFLLKDNSDYSPPIVTEELAVIVSPESESSSIQQLPNPKKSQQTQQPSESFGASQDLTSEETLNQDISQGTQSPVSETTSEQQSDRDIESEGTENKYMEWDSIVLGSDEDLKWQTMPKQVFSEKM